MRGWECRPKVFIRVYGIELNAGVKLRKARCISCGVVTRANELGFYDGKNAVCRKCLQKLAEVLEELCACHTN